MEYGKALGESGVLVAPPVCYCDDCIKRLLGTSGCLSSPRQIIYCMSFNTRLRDSWSIVKYSVLYKFTEYSVSPYGVHYVASPRAQLHVALCLIYNT
jgi:hypothetical protein